MSSAVNSDGALNKIHHVFMVSFPGQGHINPLLRLAKRLARLGLFATLCAPVCMSLSIRRANESITGDEFIPVGRGMIRFEFFDDGSEVGKFGGSHDLDSYLPQLEQAVREKLPQMIKKHEEEGRPVCCLINNPFIPWVSDVAESLGIPSAMLWVQSCACFSAYYHYHHNLVSFPSESEPEIDVRLPCMPVLKHDEVPSFLHPSTPYASLRSVILAQFKNLSKYFCILMDTLHELEPENIEYMSKLICRPIRTIGPLFKVLENSGCIDNSNSNSDAVRMDILAADNCLDWLDSKPSGSVVYISFGTVAHLKQEQVDEFAYGILGAGVSFLWVLRAPPKESNVVPLVLPRGFLDGVGDRGKIVQWSPQEEVLAHPAIACFLTHCGWNSTMEALASGVPLVAFPFWGDQVTNAKFLIDEFGVGIRMSRGEADSRIIPREEVERCLRAATSGPEVAEMKANALKWKKAAEEAVAVGGSSFMNMQEFVEEVISMGSS